MRFESSTDVLVCGSCKRAGECAVECASIYVVICKCAVNMCYLYLYQSGLLICAIEVCC